MSKKLTGNGLWESSRMILPEHKAAYLAYEKEQRQKEKRNLDEQELAVISRIMQESLQRRLPITIKMYDLFEEVKVEGIIEAIDQRGRLFRVSGDWFQLDDVEGIDDDSYPF